MLAFQFHHLRTLPLCPESCTARLLPTAPLPALAGSHPAGPLLAALHPARARELLTWSPAIDSGLGAIPGRCSGLLTTSIGSGRGPEAGTGSSCRNWSAPLPPCPRRAAIGLRRGRTACDSRQRTPGGVCHWLRGWSEDSETRAASQSSARQRSWRRGAAGARDGVTGRGSHTPGVALATKQRVPRLASAVGPLGSILLPTLVWFHPEPGREK